MILNVRLPGKVRRRIPATRIAAPGAFTYAAHRLGTESLREQRAFMYASLCEGLDFATSGSPSRGSHATYDFANVLSEFAEMDRFAGRITKKPARQLYTRIGEPTFHARFLRWLFAYALLRSSDLLARKVETYCRHSSWLTATPVDERSSVQTLMQNHPISN
jgi:hypothetical protein